MRFIRLQADANLGYRLARGSCLGSHGDKDGDKQKSRPDGRNKVSMDGVPLETRTASFLQLQLQVYYL